MLDEFEMGIENIHSAHEGGESNDSGFLLTSPLTSTLIPTLPIA